MVLHDGLEKTAESEVGLEGQITHGGEVSGDLDEILYMFNGFGKLSGNGGAAVGRVRTQGFQVDHELGKVKLVLPEKQPQRNQKPFQPGTDTGDFRPIVMKRGMLLLVSTHGKMLEIKKAGDSLDPHFHFENLRVGLSPF